jgi:hypothetical protein
VIGGFGLGRPSGSGRGKVEDCRSIDVNRLHKGGCLRPGWWDGWQWTRNGERVASINVQTEVDRLHLSYRIRIGGGEWEDVEETVRIVRVPCRFGGARPYFICSGGRERDQLRAARRQAARAGPLFPLPPLLSPRPYQPEGKWMGSSGPARDENQTAPRR